MKRKLKLIYLLTAIFISVFIPGRISFAKSEASSSVKTAVVVHVHNHKATTWDYKTGWYGDYVNQAVVDKMTDRGVMELTSASNLKDAWRTLIPSYSPGKKIAIKINLNNATYGSSGQVIDAIPQPINSVIRGLKEIGVRENDIWVYDVTHGWHIGEIPERLMKKVWALYPGVVFHSNDNLHTTALGYSNTEKVHFNVPKGRTIKDRRICKALVNATYLINMPIMKKHRMAGVSLGFKNHFGSIEGNNEVHWSTTLDDPMYLSDYNGLVDIYNNPNIKGKTVLIIGEGLYGARINNNTEIPSPWPTFGDKSPDSLFFSKDPVAIDCVMYDFLKAEGGVPEGSDNYLKLAAKSGIGVFEHRDSSNRYHLIDYRYIED